MENQPKIASVPTEKITPNTFLSLIVLIVVKAARIVIREKITTNPINSPPLLLNPFQSILRKLLLIVPIIYYNLVKWHS